jgi:hypothetical protein
MKENQNCRHFFKTVVHISVWGDTDNNLVVALEAEQ